jgi:hypothetical protein
VFPPFNPAPNTPDYGLTGPLGLHAAECTSRTVCHEAPSATGATVPPRRDTTRRWFLVKKKTINPAKYSQRDYTSSTNEGCGAAHENSGHDVAPRLGDKFFFGVPYKGSGDSGKWHSENSKHQKRVKNEAGYESEPESEDEGVEAIVVNMNDLDDDDKDLGTSKPTITGTPLPEYLQAGNYWNAPGNPYRDPSRDIAM